MITCSEKDCYAMCAHLTGIFAVTKSTSTDHPRRNHSFHGCVVPCAFIPIHDAKTHGLQNPRGKKGPFLNAKMYNVNSLLFPSPKTPISHEGSRRFTESLSHRLNSPTLSILVGWLAVFSHTNEIFHLTFTWKALVTYQDSRYFKVSVLEFLITRFFSELFRSQLLIT